MHIFDPTTLLGIHSLLSLIALVVGIPLVLGLLRGQDRPREAAIFLATAMATNLSGFILPAPGFLPSHAVGILSTAALAAAIAARYRFHLAGSWRPVYAVDVVLGEYFLVFVTIAQAFLKVPALAATVAETQAPFAVSQVIVLAAFGVLGWLGVRSFRAA